MSVSRDSFRGRRQSIPLSNRGAQPSPANRSMSSNSHRDESYLWVASYTTFANLAHAPKGTVADEGMATVRLDERTGKLETVATLGGIMNPSFCRLHPSTNMMYVATECSAPPPNPTPSHLPLARPIASPRPTVGAHTARRS